MDDRTAERFWAKVDKTKDCWVWTAATSPSGYGIFTIKPRNIPAHRFAYELLVGPIPDGLVIDHLCRNPPCVNPAHLEPVTQRENIMRGENHIADQVRRTSCPKGHPYDDENTYWQGNKRSCKTCRKEAWTRWWERDKARRRAERDAA